MTLGRNWMKILGINGSPNRNGSTAAIILKLGAESEKLGAQFELIDMDDYNIEFCQNLKTCYSRLTCGIDDDFTQLKAKMLEADAIIIGSPYYSGRLVLRLQALFDRLKYSAFFKKDFRGKYIIGVSTSAVDKCKDVAEYCANLGFSNRLSGAVTTALIHETMVMEAGIRDIEDDKILNEHLIEVAAKLINDMKSKRIPIFQKIMGCIIGQYVSFAVATLVFGGRRLNNSVEEYLEEKGWTKNSRKLKE